MAQGVAVDFDFAELGKAIKKAESELNHLVKVSDNTANSLTNTFSSMSLENKLDASVKKLSEMREVLRQLGVEQLKAFGSGAFREGLGQDIKNTIDAVSKLTDGIGKLQTFINGISGTSEQVFGVLIDNMHKSSFELSQMSHYYANLERIGIEAQQKSSSAKNSAQEWRDNWNERMSVWEKGFDLYQKGIEQQAKSESENAKQVSRQWAESYEQRLRAWEHMFDEIIKRESQEEEKRRLNSPEGALEYASNAKSQAEMEQAMKYLDSARKNIDVTTKEGIDLNDSLIKKYGELKTAIEELEGKTKDQNTLVATESAKYARLLKEIGKYKKSLEELRKTEAYKSGYAQARNAERDLQDEIRILEKRKDLYAANKESIKQASIQVAADTAREETEIIKREEAARAKEAEREREEEISRARQRYAELLKEQDALTKEVNRGFEVKTAYGDEEGYIGQAHETVKQEWNRVYEERKALEEKFQGELTDIQEKHQAERNKKAIANAEEFAKKQAKKAAEAEKKAKEETEKYRKTTKGSIEYAKEAKTIKELVQAYKYLEEAKRNVNLSTKEGKKELKELSQNMEEVRNTLSRYGASVQGTADKHNQLFHTGEQLKRMLTGLFSVSAIRRYISNVIQLRGEFELQQMSLQALLQNKDEADKLWDKTIQLAVRSPFQVKELVTYTKQLAAYRLEADKLYDTTKMLADISSGLGVDMQRLILAYGQVKAANYLRGTELRQFSEAGINVLEELSKYFTELEGRVVSVGDVFERVSKRMVSFSAVEEVLKRVTSEGGMFYNMQEVQAETIKGMMSNLQDSVDIMLNEIGKDHEEFIKKSIKSVRQLMEGWRDLVPVIKTAGIAFLTFKSINGLASLSNTKLAKTLKIGAFNMELFGEATGLATIATKGLNKVLTAGAWGIALAAIALIVKGIYNLWNEATKAERALKQLNKELQKIKDEDVAGLEQQVAVFENLVVRLGEATEGTAEYDRILSQITSQYGEYLGFLEEEAISYENIANNVDRVVYSLTQKAQANTFEKAYNKTIETQLKIIGDSRKTITEKIFNKGSIYAINEKNGLKFSWLPTTEEVDNIFDAIKKKVVETGQKISGIDLEKIIEEVAKIDADINNVTHSLYFREFSTISEAFLAMSEASTKLAEDLSSLYGTNTDASKFFKQMEDFEARAKQKRNSEEYRNASEPEKEKIERELAQEKYTLQFTYELSPEGGSVDAAVSKAMDEWDKHSDVIKKFNQKITQKLAGKDNLVINAVFQEQATANTKSVNQLLEEFVSGYKNQEEEIKRLNGLKKEGAVYSEEENVELKKQLATANDLKLAYYEAIKLLGGLDLLPENQKQLEDFKKRVSLIEEMRKKYEELRRMWSSDKALSMVQSSYAEAWEAVGGQRWEIPTIGLDDVENTAIYIEQVLIPLIEDLPKKAQKSARQVATKAAAGLRAMAGEEEKKMSDNELKRQVEDLFESYALFEELKKLGVPTTLAEELFGLTPVDLKELRHKLEAMLPKFVGTPMEEFYKQQLEKLADMEDKDRRERLKKYLKYTREAIGERAKIKIEELQNLREIEDTFEEGETKNRAIEGVRKEAKDALMKYDWEQFKSSDVFASLFSDLENASATSIEFAIKQIKKYKDEWSDMPVSEAKEMIAKLDELELALQMIEKPRTASKAIISRLESAMAIRGINPKEFSSYAQLKDKLGEENVALELENQGYNNEISSLETLLQLFAEKKLVISQLTDEEKKLLGIIDETSVVEEVAIREAISSRKALIEANKDSIDTNNELLDLLLALLQIYKTQQEYQEKWLGLVNDAYGAVKDLASVFGDISTEGEVWWDLGDQMINLISQSVQLYWQIKTLEVQATKTGIAMNAAFGPIGWIVLALQAVTTVVKAIADIRQARIDEEIEDQYKKIDDLNKLYEKLENGIEEAYDIHSLNMYNKEVQDNLELQKEAAAAAKEAAESGKNNKKNQESAEEAQDKYDEILEQIAEKTREAFSTATAGIFDDTISTAERYVDAWLEAYREVGDGMSGLTEQMEEDMENVAKRQAAYAIVGQFVKQWENELAKAMGDNELTSGELNEYIELVQENLPKLNKNLAEFYKDMPFLDGGNELSGLQKGIQGMTADQADVLTAYWNSVRFYMASIDQKFDIPLSTILSSDVEANPILGELRAITANQNKLYDFLNGMTASHPTNGGRGIKVVM